MKLSAIHLHNVNVTTHLLTELQMPKALAHSLTSNTTAGSGWWFIYLT